MIVVSSHSVPDLHHKAPFQCSPPSSDLYQLALIASPGEHNKLGILQPPTGELCGAMDVQSCTPMTAADLYRHAAGKHGGLFKLLLDNTR